MVFSSDFEVRQEMFAERSKMLGVAYKFLSIYFLRNFAFEEQEKLILVVRSANDSQTVAAERIK